MVALPGVQAGTVDLVLVQVVEHRPVRGEVQVLGHAPRTRGPENGRQQDRDTAGGAAGAAAPRPSSSSSSTSSSSSRSTTPRRGIHVERAVRPVRSRGASYPVCTGGIACLRNVPFSSPDGLPRSFPEQDPV